MVAGLELAGPYRSRVVGIRGVFCVSVFCVSRGHCRKWSSCVELLTSAQRQGSSCNRVGAHRNDISLLTKKHQPFIVLSPFKSCR